MSLYCRRYFGHKPTIRPDAKKLYRLFMNKDNMSWEAFASKVGTYQKGFMGEPNEVRPGRGQFHENPTSCICGESGDNNAKIDPGSQKSRKEGDAARKDVEEDDQSIDDEMEWMDPDDEDDQAGPQEIGLANGTGLDYGVVATDEPELEEMLSD